MMICRHCGQPVVLSPSASERARKSGGRPSDYTKLFPDHAECVIAALTAGAKELMRRKAQEHERSRVVVLNFKRPLAITSVDEQNE